MVEIREAPEFTNWLAALKGQRAILHIVRRINRLAAGTPGDTKSVGGPVMELRIDHGPGYRVYYTRGGQVLVILLCGGDKRRRAKTYERPSKWRKHWRTEHESQ
jgi:putative addiction module killer protein